MSIIDSTPIMSGIDCGICAKVQMVNSFLRVHYDVTLFSVRMLVAIWN